MTQRINSIYFAPHFDDATLSCGGRIATETAAGDDVLIVTIMAGEPPTDELPPFAAAHHALWQLSSDAVDTRRTEDGVACQILGARAEYWSVPDAIYRGTGSPEEAFYCNNDKLFGTVNSAEAALIDSLAEQMRQLPPADTIIAPLAVGSHVDHQVVRMAAEAVYGSSLTYFEDYPYIQKWGIGDVVDAPGWHSTLVSFSDDALAKKLAAVAAYSSQINHLFFDEKDMRENVKAFAARTGKSVEHRGYAERFWQYKEPNPASP